MATQKQRLSPYEQFASAELILRDHLALDRTILANERTVLAYGRTGLSVVIAGAGLIKLFEGPATHISGYLLIAFGVAITAFGFDRYVRMQRAISCLRRESREVEQEYQSTLQQQTGV